MKTLAISSMEALDTAAGECTRTRIQLTRWIAQRDAAVAALENEYQPAATGLTQKIAALEASIQDYCAANRAALFPQKKSRETHLAEFGFEMTPPRVETANKKIKWKDVVARLARVAWGRAYIRTPECQVNKQALLSDREKLTPEHCLAAGIQFCQDEQFFIRPKPETAQLTLKEG